MEKKDSNKTGKKKLIPDFSMIIYFSQIQLYNLECDRWLQNFIKHTYINQLNNFGMF